MKKGQLVLKNGATFDGYIFGAETPSAGEVVFSTGMVGYPESLTDPSYTGQILTFTYPLIGNYGIPADKKNIHGFSKVFEGEKISVKGIVVSEYSETHSHWRAQKSLSDWLKQAGLPGITGIDTRALTKILRTEGSMPGKILVEQKPDIDLYDPNLKNLVAKVSPKKPKTYKAGKKTIVMMDCGVKNNTIRNFLNRGITVIRVPWDFDFIAEGIQFDGLFVSNGPGDPALLKSAIEIIKKSTGAQKTDFRHLFGQSTVGPRRRIQNLQNEIRKPLAKPTMRGHRNRPLLHDNPKPRFRGGQKNHAKKLESLV